ncbi:rhodanese-like domain-containing protein [Blastococcus sp. VKM Ac-2987]|uniref:rhodanese-like domain-containing protein n=1 Tax=Blastococcus sp. VKM Ac-2987 TaxID=3004141 RepID=UPI0022AB87B5|nr:rhodanese-like domain-containing protein [Blastococcus sp. VKM Ac-2987]MCZ2858177.1 rhodanese-like domain-containing protein [Blastococcus sp. VKM Ac-2987]
MNSRTTALITPAELTDRLTGDTAPTLVDVRTPAEYETAHIPGSINIPLPLVTEHATALAAAGPAGPWNARSAWSPVVWS